MRNPIALLCVLQLLAAAAHGIELETVAVAMRDGTRLATDVFRPSGPDRYPTILVRTPYGRDFVPIEVAKVLTDGLGYGLVVQDVRGRFDSEGIDDVFLSDGWGENQDGYDTIEWIVDQAWSDGRVGLFGASAFGITAYLAMGTYHPAIRAAHVGITPWIFYDVAYQDGAFREGLIVDWLEGQGASYMLETYYEHPIYDDFWASLDMRTRAAIEVPTYHWGGWYDCFAAGPLEAFAQLSDRDTDGGRRRSPQRLLVGPWTHVDLGAFSRRQGELVYPEGSTIPFREANPLAWFRRFLKNDHRALRDEGRDEGWPVTFYLMGDVDAPGSAGNRWVRARDWPVPMRRRPLYLTGEGGLSAVRPPAAVASAPLADPVTYLADPADPSPTIGGAELSLPSGPRDQTPLLARDDVLAFRSEVLTESLTLVGKVEAVVFAASDRPDTDITVRLADVYPDGRLMLVADGIAKGRYLADPLAENFLTPGEATAFKVDLGPTAIVFDPGHRIAVLVSSSNAPRFVPSKNNDDHIWGDEPPLVAANNLYLGGAYPSRLILPEPDTGALAAVADRKDGPRPDDIQRARQRLARGERLTAADHDALSAFAGEGLLRATLERIAAQRAATDRPHKM